MSDWAVTKSYVASLRHRRARGTWCARVHAQGISRRTIDRGLVEAFGSISRARLDTARPARWRPPFRRMSAPRCFGRARGGERYTRRLLDHGAVPRHRGGDPHAADRQRVRRVHGGAPLAGLPPGCGPGTDRGVHATHELHLGGDESRDACVFPPGRERDRRVHRAPRPQPAGPGSGGGRHDALRAAAHHAQRARPVRGYRGSRRRLGLRAAQLLRRDLLRDGLRGGRAHVGQVLPRRAHVQAEAGQGGPDARAQAEEAAGAGGGGGGATRQLCVRVMRQTLRRGGVGRRRAGEDAPHRRGDGDARGERAPGKSPGEERRTRSRRSRSREGGAPSAKAGGSAATRAAKSAPKTTSKTSAPSARASAKSTGAKEPAGSSTAAGEKTTTTATAKEDDTRVSAGAREKTSDATNEKGEGKAETR